MKHILEEPVHFGDAQLAPTVELAGLAEIASLATNEARAEALVRIAEAIQAEDNARAHLSSVRANAGTSLAPLPKRAQRGR